jgi:hypothetical protein
MSPYKFWNLTWYDWGLYILRYKEEQDEKRLEEELKWVPWRELYAIICNINRDSKKRPTPFRGPDFIKLSFDKEKEEEVKKKVVIDDEYLKRLKARYSK